MVKIDANDVSALFTMVAGLAAAYSIRETRKSAKEQRQVRALETRSRRFEVVVLGPLQNTIPEFVKAVDTLLVDGAKQLELLCQEDIPHSTVMKRTQALADAFDAEFYDLKMRVKTALAAWPDSALTATVLRMLDGMQDQVQNRIQMLAATPGAVRVPTELVQAQASQVLRAVIEYDFDQHIYREDEQATTSKLWERVRFWRKKAPPAVNDATPRAITSGPATSLPSPRTEEAQRVELEHPDE